MRSKEMNYVIKTYPALILILLVAQQKQEIQVHIFIILPYTTL